MEAALVEQADLGGEVDDALAQGREVPLVVAAGGVLQVDGRHVLHHLPQLVRPVDALVVVVNVPRVEIQPHVGMVDSRHRSQSDAGVVPERLVRLDDQRDVMRGGRLAHLAEAAIAVLRRSIAGLGADERQPRAELRQDRHALSEGGDALITGGIARHGHRGARKFAPRESGQFGLYVFRRRRGNLHVSHADTLQMRVRIAAVFAVAVQVTGEDILAHVVCLSGLPVVVFAKT